MNATVRFNDTKYHPQELDRRTPATVIKYIAPRVIAPTTPNSFQGPPLRGIARYHENSQLPAITSTTDLTLGSIVSNGKYSNISAIHSIDGERIIDEHRALSRITGILTNTILQCCHLESHNRAQELQIEWLENHRQDNDLVIEKMFQIQMDSAKTLVNQNSEQKSTLVRKVSEVETTTSAHHQQYQQLLAGRTAMSKDLFDFERQIAQNAAEMQFLRRRITHLDDESQFYLLKNRSFDDRKTRLRYELDEELYSQETLKIELEVLQKEKITRDDVHLVSLDEIRISIDTSQIAGIQPSRVFLDQLNSEVQRIRNEYESKIETYRDEIQHKLELELHVYQMHKTRPIATITKDQELQLEQYQLETRDVVKQIGVTRERINEITLRMEAVEKKLISQRASQESEYRSKREITLLNQLIEDREQQLQEALRKRNDFKREIELYKARMARRSGDKTILESAKRRSVQESNQSYTEKRVSRLSYQELTNGNNAEYRPPTTAHLPPKQRSSVLRIEEFSDGGTLTGYSGFTVDQDCENLQRLVSHSNIDEVSSIRILCNRSVGQRLQIRERYETLFNENLRGAFDKINDHNLSKLLRMLLLSPAERDCFELQRLSRSSTFDETIFVEIIFSRSNKHIQLVRDTYRKLFKNSLETDVLGDGNSPLNRIFLALLQSNRPEDNNVNDNEILKDARTLYETGTEWTKNGSTFVRLLCTRSNTQLKQIFAAYEQFSQIDIEKAIRIHIEENLYHTFMAIVRIVRNRPRYFAYKLKKYLKGVNANEDSLNRIMVSRCEVDMIQIKIEYEKIGQRTLYSHIQTDINSNYKRALLELIRQRAEPDTRVSSTEQPEQLTVQWRESFNRVSSDTSIRRSTDHTVSERSVIGKRESDDDQSKVITFSGPYENSNQVKKRSLLILNTKSFRPRDTDQHSFEPMSTIPDSPYDFKEVEEEEEEEEE